MFLTEERLWESGPTSQHERETEWKTGEKITRKQASSRPSDKRDSFIGGAQRRKRLRKRQRQKQPSTVLCKQYSLEKKDL